MDISRSIENAVSTYFDRWLQKHQLIWWLIGHPVWIGLWTFLDLLHLKSTHSLKTCE